MILRSLRLRLLTALSLGFALASLAVACGDDAEITTPPPPADGAAPDASTPDVTRTDAPVSSNGDVDAFCRGTLGLYAPAYEACCDRSDAPNRYAFDTTLLKALFEMCTTSLGKSVQSGRATFVPAAAATCETNVSGPLKARTCPQVLRSERNQTPDSIWGDAAGCSEVIVGRQADGAPCASDYECIDGLTCVGWTSIGDGKTSDGTCKAPPGDGGLCGYGIPDGGGFLELVRWGFGTHPRCAAGFYCASTALQHGTCKPQMPADGECDSHDECVQGLRCQVGVCGTAGPAPAGSPCERASDCQDALTCKSGDGGRTCAERAIAGSPCGNTLGSECQGACVKPDGGDAATCVAYCGSQ